MYIYKLIDTDSFSDIEYAACLPSLSDEKRRRLDRLVSVPVKKLTVAGDYLARSLAAELFGHKPDSLTVVYDKYGKPFIENIPVSISISHSGNYALAAASLNPVGADIERIKTIKQNVAKRFCSNCEFEYLQSDINTFGRRAVSLWTMKEAYGKMLGIGVFAPCRFSAEIDSGEPKQEYGGYKFDFPKPPDDYIICICETA